MDLVVLSILIFAICFRAYSNNPIGQEKFVIADLPVGRNDNFVRNNDAFMEVANGLGFSTFGK